MDACFFPGFVSDLHGQFLPGCGRESGDASASFIEIRRICFCIYLRFEVAWHRPSPGGFAVALGDWASGVSALGLAVALALARAPSGSSAANASPHLVASAPLVLWRRFPSCLRLRLPVSFWPGPELLRRNMLGQAMVPVV